MDRPTWMTRDWLDGQIRKLKAARDRLRVEIEKGAGELGAKGTPVPREPGDVAEEDREDNEVAGTMEVSQTRFTETEGAIARIDQKGYGRCMDCNVWISKERLEALPAAVRCVPCQEAHERRGGETPTTTARR